MKKLIPLTVSLLIPIIFLPQVHANTSSAHPVESRLPYLYKYEGNSLEFALGHLSGKSKEIAYDENGKKLSQLDWKIRSAVIAKGAFNSDLLHYLSINMNGWTTIAKGDGKMDDNDWSDPNSNQLTDHSTHPETDLKKAYEYDVNIRGWLINRQSIQLGAIIGYHYNQLNFEAKGGQYFSGNGTYLGAYPDNEKIISYTQKFHAPYIGIASFYAWNKFEFTGLLKYSPIARAKAKDEHHILSKVYTDSSKKMKYFSASFNGGYYLSPKTKLFLDVTYQHYSMKKGNSSVQDYANNTSYYYKNGSEMGHKNIVIGLGLNWRF